MMSDGSPTPSMIDATSEWTGLIETTTLGVSARAGEARRTVEAKRRAVVDFIVFSSCPGGLCRFLRTGVA
ncbi:hypothetical protein ACVI1N_004373 [Sinorhizobium medicae]